MAARKPAFADSVFINCPFDPEYWPLLEAVLFAVIGCGFVPRCALEAQDSGQPRLEKILRLIDESKYGIHDLSRVELDDRAGLPRFNMPFELGLDLAARRFAPKGSRLKTKQLLVMEAERYRYQALVSDIAGQDIRTHGNAPDTVIETVRDWLRTASGRTTLPGPVVLTNDFSAFSAAVPGIARDAGVEATKLTYLDYVQFATSWLGVS
jgi:hypothetical protein